MTCCFRVAEVPLTLAPFSPHRAFCRHLSEPVVAAIVPGKPGVDRAAAGTNDFRRSALSWHLWPLVSHFRTISAPRIPTEESNSVRMRLRRRRQGARILPPRCDCGAWKPLLDPIHYTLRRWRQVGLMHIHNFCFDECDQTKTYDSVFEATDSCSPSLRECMRRSCNV